MKEAYTEAVPTATEETLELLQNFRSGAQSLRLRGLVRLGLSYKELIAVTDSTPDELVAVLDGDKHLGSDAGRMQLDCAAHISTILLRRTGKPEPVTEQLRLERESLGGDSLISVLASDPCAAVREASALSIDLYNRAHHAWRYAS